MDRLTIHFPKTKKLVLEIMDTIIKQSEFKQQRLDAFYRNYIHERSDLKRKAQVQVEEMLITNIENNKKKADKLAI